MGILETIPHRITGPAAWVGSEMRDAPDLWLYTLSADEIDALDTAAAQYLAQNRDIADITAASFPLGAMAPVVDQLSKTLLRRHGFMVLRGLPIKRYDQRTAAAIFCGIGAHLGSARSQMRLVISWAMCAMLAPILQIPTPVFTKPPYGKVFTPTARTLWR